MWIERKIKKSKFINDLLKLKGQVLVIRGARQVGKTSFVLNALKELPDNPQLKLNLLYPGSFRLDGIDYLGKDFFGPSETGETFLKNIEAELGSIKNLSRPALIFIDEVDRYPMAMESIQMLAEFSDKLKFIFTGSNLENIFVKNAATGRKKTFDLYPITFTEFIEAGGHEKLLDCLRGFSLNRDSFSEYHHKQLSDLVKIYIRIGGMPKIVEAYLDTNSRSEIPEIVKDLAFSIEENVKTVLGEKAKLYEYEDVLRKMVRLSLNTLKYSHLQVQHAGRSEAKKLVSKTVGAHVAHKIRLFESEKDLSKFMIFDCGIANYLLNGSDLLKTVMDTQNEAILYETFVGMELISNLVTRDDLFYWKSENKAEVEFLLRSPFIGIDVKTKKGNIKSLNSLAIFEPKVSCIVKICDDYPHINLQHEATLQTDVRKRNVSLVVIPHYMTCRLVDLVTPTTTAEGKL